MVARSKMDGLTVEPGDDENCGWDDEAKGAAHAEMGKGTRGCEGGVGFKWFAPCVGGTARNRSLPWSRAAKASSESSEKHW